MIVSKRVADLVLNGDIYCEFKSWTDYPNFEQQNDDGIVNISKSAFTNFKEGAGSFPQFLGYLAEVKSMNQLRYYFDKRKLSAKGSDAEIETFLKKDVFQACMYNGTDLTANGILVFNEIWNNVDLRGSIWNSNNYPNLTQNQALPLFQSMISDISNSVYDFIKVK